MHGGWRDRIALVQAAQAGHLPLVLSWGPFGHVTFASLPGKLQISAKLIPNAKNDAVVDVYELVINGVEISPGYSELNDPVVQRERLEHQAGEETQKIDEEFITAACSW